MHVWKCTMCSILLYGTYCILYNVHVYIQYMHSTFNNYFSNKLPASLMCWTHIAAVFKNGEKANQLYRKMSDFSILTVNILLFKLNLKWQHSEILRPRLFFSWSEPSDVMIRINFVSKLHVFWTQILAMQILLLAELKKFNRNIWAKLKSNGENN